MKQERKEKRVIRKEARKELRINQGNTPPFWKKVRNIATIVALIGGSVLTTIATGGLALPAAVLTTVTTITAIAGGVAGTAVFTKKDEIKE